MKALILAALSPVRIRQRIQFAYSAATLGLFGSGAVGLALGIARLITGEAVALPVLLTVLVTPPLVGAIIGFLWKPSWNSSAHAVDAHYHLKDRTVTALEFSESPERSPFHELQLRDATERLKTVNAQQVVPFRMPRQMPWVAAALTLAGVVLLYPLPPRQVQAAFVQPAGIQLAADEIAADLDELDEFAAEEQIDELKETLDQLRKELDELKDPDTDVREALATISEMQEKLAKQQAQYNDALVDAQLQSVGAALAGAQAFQSAGAELEEGDFEKAAEELEKLEQVDLQRKEARSTGEALAKAAAAMQNAGLGQLSDSVSQLSDGVKSQDSSKACEACQRLAKDVRRHSLCKSVNSLLQRKLTKLGECKSLCKKAGMCKTCGGSCQGQCQGLGFNLALGFNPNRSDSSSKSAGSASSGNINGEMTKLDSQRNFEELTGQLSGEGESEFETTASPEGREAARRQVRESFAKYQKMSEAVLESEPIPLGHRQTIRRYFELIRPHPEDVIVDGE